MWDKERQFRNPRNSYLRKYGGQESFTGWMEVIVRETLFVDTIKSQVGHSRCHEQHQETIKSRLNKYCKRVLKIKLFLCSECEDFFQCASCIMLQIKWITDLCNYQNNLMLGTLFLKLNFLEQVEGQLFPLHLHLQQRIGHY